MAASPRHWPQATTPNASPVDAHGFEDSALLATVPAFPVNTQEDNRLLSQITIFEKLGTPDSSPDNYFPVLDDFDELDDFRSNPQPGTQENDVPQNNSAGDSNLIEPVYDIVYNASDEAAPEVSVANYTGKEASYRDETSRPKEKTLEGLVLEICL